MAKITPKPQAVARIVRREWPSGTGRGRVRGVITSYSIHYTKLYEEGARDHDATRRLTGARQKDRGPEVAIGLRGRGPGIVQRDEIHVVGAGARQVATVASDAGYA